STVGPPTPSGCRSTGATRGSPSARPSTPCRYSRSTPMQTSTAPSPSSASCARAVSGPGVRRRRCPRCPVLSFRTRSPTRPGPRSPWGGSGVASREIVVAELPQHSEPAVGSLSDLARRLVDPFRTVSPPEPRPATGFFTDTTVCIGCKACEVACKEWNLLPADGLHWTGNSYDNTGELSATSARHGKLIDQLRAP